MSQSENQNKVSIRQKKIYERLFAEYYSPLCLFANKYMEDLNLAKDLVQDVFVKLWEKDIQITKEETIKSYLYVSVRNICLNHLRQKPKEEERISEYTDLDDQLHEDILEEDVHYKLYHAVNKLSLRNKESMLLTIRGYSNQEIAEEMKISVNSVKTLKQRAYRFLRDDLKNDFKLFQFFFI